VEELMRYAIVRDGVIENVILWDGASPWVSPPLVEVYPLEDGVAAAVGWTWLSGPVRPPQPEPAPEQVAALHTSDVLD
jgi:hypothetical protein